MPNNLISIQALDEVMTDIGSARGMPNAAYHSEELFRFERDEVLSKTWAGLVFLRLLLKEVLIVLRIWR